MKFSTSIEYAIHGLLYLARSADDRPVLAGDVARAIRVPEGYLRKVFQQLVRSGIVASQRGSRGGFRLARPPQDISLKDVVESIDGALPVYSCLKTLRSCRLGTDCPVQEAFDQASRRMGDVLEAVTIRDAARGSA